MDKALNWKRYLLFTVAAMICMLPYSLVDRMSQISFSAQPFLWQILGPLFQPQPSSGTSVAFDAVGPSASGQAQQSGNNSWTTFNNTWTHVVASGGSLVVGCSFSPSNTSVATMSATYNGTSMGTGSTVLPNNDATQGLIEIWKVLSPTSGSHSVVVTATYVSGTKASGDHTLCGSVSFTGATGFGTAVTAFGSSTAPSVTVSSATNDMVVDVVSSGTSITSSNKTLRWDTNTATGEALLAAGQSTAAGAASVTMGYTIPTDVWGIIAVDVQ